MEDLYGQCMGEATIITANQQVTKQVEPVNAAAKALDEIGILPEREGPVVHDAYSSYYQCQGVEHM